MAKLSSPGNPNTDIWKLLKVSIPICRFKAFTVEVMDITEMKTRSPKEWLCWRIVLCTVLVRSYMWKELPMYRNLIRQMYFRTRTILLFWWMQIIRKLDRKRFVPMNSARLLSILHCHPLVWMGCFRWKPAREERIFAWRTINVRRLILLSTSSRAVINWAIR